MDAVGQALKWQKCIEVMQQMDYRQVGWMAPVEGWMVRVGFRDGKDEVIADVIMGLVLYQCKYYTFMCNPKDRGGQKTLQFLFEWGDIPN